MNDCKYCAYMHYSYNIAICALLIIGMYHIVNYFWEGKFTNHYITATIVW